MKFADTVRNYFDGHGERFDFLDRSGHIHGEYRKGCPVSPAPDDAIGAVKIGESWFWVIRGAEKEMRDLHNSAHRLAISLSAIVDCGGIGPEDMYDEARDALKQYNNL